MRLHRFFINKPLEYTREVIKDEHLIHQWRDVFRYNVGSEIILFDGKGSEFDSVIEKLNNREAEVRLVSERKGVVPDKKIILCQSLIKKDKMEWMVEKATELGVSKIIPIVSERSEKKSFNIERAKKIAIEAAEQCGRADVPKIEEIVNLSEALKNSENAVIFDSNGDNLNYELRITNYGTGENSSLHDSYFINHNSFFIFIGPEGGWTEREIEEFKKSGAEIFSLGKLTLRAETAAIAALTILKFPD